MNAKDVVQLQERLDTYKELELMETQLTDTIESVQYSLRKIRQGNSVDMSINVRQENEFGFHFSVQRLGEQYPSMDTNFSLRILETYVDLLHEQLNKIQLMKSEL